MHSIASDSEKDINRLVQRMLVISFFSSTQNAKDTMFTTSAQQAYLTCDHDFSIAV